MNRRRFTGKLIAAPLILSSVSLVDAQTPEATPGATPATKPKLDPKDKYPGKQTDMLDEPWLLGDHWVEFGLKDIQRYPSDTPGTYTFHDGDLKIEFQSVLTAIAGWAWIIVGTQTDLSEIEGVYTAVVRGYYRGMGELEESDLGKLAILEAIELFSNETPR